MTLSGNLDCSSYTAGNAITIGAAGLTVNLNGFSILGPGANAGTEGIADSPGDSAGASYDDITVEGGYMSNFATDIDIEGVINSSPPPDCTTDLTGAVVDDITISNQTVETGDGIFGNCLSGAHIESMSISDADYGIELQNSESSKVNYNHLNSPFVGLYDDLGSGDTWAHNSISNVSYYGIEVYESTSDTVKANSIINGRTSYGIYDFESSGSTFNKNVLNNLADGIYQTEATSATVNSNKGSGDAFGLYADDSQGTATYNNNQFNHGQYGIETDNPADETLTGNVTSHNSESGVYIYVDNTSGPYSATLNGNSANYNRFGLYSMIATSGSGNHATGNKIVNCYNVTCG